MGVAVLPMINAKASGVLFTRQPEAADQDAALINAVWGLGRYAVGGVIEPDYYLAAYDGPGQILEKRIPPKRVMLVSTPGAAWQRRRRRRKWCTPLAWRPGISSIYAVGGHPGEPLPTAPGRGVGLGP